MCRTQLLEDLLTERLPKINRWNAVKVFNYNSPNIPYGVNIRNKHFIIYWHRPKGRNFHPYEYKEIPLAHLHRIIEKNYQRLKNNTQAYK